MIACLLCPQPVFFPDDIGVPFGRPDHQECVLLETHVNNQDNVKGLKIETGMTLYYTKELRHVTEPIILQQIGTQ